MGDEAIRKADAHDPGAVPRTIGEGFLEVLQHRRAETAGEDKETLLLIADYVVDRDS